MVHDRSRVAAFVLQKHQYPHRTNSAGFVLAPRFEQAIRRALAISQGSAMIFIQKPIAAFLLILTLFFILSPLVLKIIGKHRANSRSAA